MAKASWKKRMPQTATFGIPVNVIATAWGFISMFFVGSDDLIVAQKLVVAFS